MLMLLQQGREVPQDAICAITSIVQLTMTRDSGLLFGRIPFSHSGDCASSALQDHILLSLLCAIIRVGRSDFPCSARAV